MRTAAALAIVLTVAGCGGAQASGDRQQPAPAPAPAFDSARAWEHLRRQVEIGPRPAGSEALVRTRRYIIDTLEGLAIETREQRFTASTPAGPIDMANVIGVIPGRRADRIILASHYDTKRAPFRFVGANDGASSTAVLLELARALARRRGDFTIELLFLDGEEAVNWEWSGSDNTYGSRHYVADADAARTLAGVQALVLLDMVGERRLMVRREGKSTPWLVDVIWSTARRLGYGATFSNEVMDVDDDHVPFLRAGVPAVDVIDLDYPEWHTEKDDLDRVDAESLGIVGEVILAALPAIEERLGAKQAR